jgi:CheY-like chemotaxis protein
MIAALKILYLENHAIFAQQVTRQFLSGHEVTIVPSLSAARDALASAHFDLVLSDYDIDEGKGDEFVRECRAANPELPIVAVSSHEEGNAALVKAGASAICGKMDFQRIQQVIAGLKLS